MPVPELPAAIKAEILKMAHSTMSLKQLKNIACRSSMVLCPEDVRTCLKAFVPAEVFGIGLISRGDNLYDICVRSGRLQVSLETIFDAHPQIIKDEPFKPAGFSQALKTCYVYAPPDAAAADHPLTAFATLCQNALHAAFPSMKFSAKEEKSNGTDSRTRWSALSTRMIGKKYLIVECERIMCNRPYSSS
jgi:hypothetical protein